MLSGSFEKQNMAPKGYQHGAQNGSQNYRFGDLPNVSWICYLLYLEHISLPRVGPKRPPNSEQASELLPNLILIDLGRIWASTWRTIWHHFVSSGGGDIFK